MDMSFIDDVLIESKDKQLKYLDKIKKIKDAIATLEEEDIALPESVYGTLDYYNSEYRNEVNAYNDLLKVCKHEEERVH